MDNIDAPRSTTPKAKTPRPRPDVFNDSRILMSKKCRTSTPSSRIIPPRPPTKSVQRWRNQARSRIRRLNRYYEQVTMIGSGHFADVYSAKSLEDGLLYAIKKTRLPFQSRAERQRRLVEVRNHESIPPHPNCVQYYKSWEEDGLLYIQTELCKTTLNELIETAEENKLPEHIVWTYLVDLLLAIKHLHDHDLIHLDIKPENIFISFDDIAKLGDFGLMYDSKKHQPTDGMLGSPNSPRARDINTTASFVSKCHENLDLDQSVESENGCSSDIRTLSDESDSIDEGDSKYLAKDLLQGKFTKAADVFSLGITIFEIASGMDLPKGGVVYQMLRQNKIDNNYFRGLSDDLVQVIKLMMEADYQRRPTVNDLLEHPKIKQMVSSRTKHIQLKSNARAFARRLSLLYYIVLTTLTSFVSLPSTLFTAIKGIITRKIISSQDNPNHELSPSRSETPNNGSSASSSRSSFSRRRDGFNSDDLFDSSFVDDDLLDFYPENSPSSIIKARPKNLLNIFKEIDSDGL